MRGQDEVTRRRRLNNGCCPTHGIGLTQGNVIHEDGEDVGYYAECPRNDCDFKVAVRIGSRLWEVWNE